VGAAETMPCVLLRGDRAADVAFAPDSEQRERRKRKAGVTKVATQFFMIETYRPTGPSFTGVSLITCVQDALARLVLVVPGFLQRAYHSSPPIGFRPSSDWGPASDRHGGFLSL
jgi:hypothetical protein